MSEFPISEGALEAVANALEEKDENTVYYSWKSHAKDAIAAFVTAEQMRVEKRGPITGPPTEERIAGRWKPLGGGDE